MVLGDETPVGGDDLFVAGITVHAEGFMPGSRLLRRPPPTRGFIALCGGFGIFLARLARVGDENGDQPVADGQPGNDGEELGEGHGATACVRSVRVAFSRSSAGASSSSVAISIASPGTGSRRPLLCTRFTAIAGPAPGSNPTPPPRS